jgi:hypothetical protein
MVTAMQFEAVTISTALTEQLIYKKLKVMQNAYEDLMNMEGLTFHKPKVVIPSESLDGTALPAVGQTMFWLKAAESPKNSASGDFNLYYNGDFTATTHNTNVVAVNKYNTKDAECTIDTDAGFAKAYSQSIAAVTGQVIYDELPPLPSPPKSIKKKKTVKISMYDGYPAPVDTPMGKTAGKAKLAFHHLNTDNSTVCGATVKVTKISEQDAATVLAHFASFLCSKCVAILKTGSAG